MLGCDDCEPCLDMIICLFGCVNNSRLIHVEYHKGNHFPLINEMVYMRLLNLFKMVYKCFINTKTQFGEVWTSYENLVKNRCVA